MLRVFLVGHLKSRFVYLCILADMPHAREYFKIFPEIFLDRLRFCRALYDYQIFYHNKHYNIQKRTQVRVGIT